MKTQPTLPILNQSVLLSSAHRKGLVLAFAAIAFVAVLTIALEVAQTGVTYQLWFSYLVAFLFALTICLGSLFFVLLQHIVGSVWSVGVRRIAETFAAVLPIFSVLFVPIALHVKDIFPWARDPYLLQDENERDVLLEVLHHKGAYLNLRFFLIRAAVYLTIWSVLGLWVYITSRKLDHTGDSVHLKRLRRLSPPAMLLFALSLTFSGFDWVMSLHPDWYSTMFGVYIFSGSVVSSLACITGVVLCLHRIGLLRDVITKEHYHDLGKLTFGFVVFWAYIAFSQYFLIWYANIPEETHYFGVRWFVSEGDVFDPNQEGSWALVAKALILFQFIIPFWILLSRYSKRSPFFLGLSTIFLVVAHYIDLYWFVMPEFHRTGAVFHWLDISSLALVVGIVGAVFAYQLGKAPLIPVRDPLLPASVEFENV